MMISLENIVHKKTSRIFEFYIFHCVYSVYSRKNKTVKMCDSKMKLFIVILLTSSIWQQHAYGFITIQIEPENLQQIGEVIMQAYMQQQPIVLQTPTTRCAHISSAAKKISRGIIQLLGIMMTLVGANLLTTKLESFVVVNQPEFSAKNITTPTIIQSDKCHEYDYGCDDNLCWRTCDVSADYEKSVENINQPWCYTSPNESEFQPCNFSYECSPCWNCLSPCKTKTYK